jgi:hypothetical protein
LSAYAAGNLVNPALVGRPQAFLAEGERRGRQVPRLPKERGVR